MKISVEKISTGTSLKCYIPKSETDSIMNFSNDATKDFRKQKTYKINLSKQKIAVIQTILEDLFSNFSIYKILNNSNQNISYDLVRNKVFQNIESSLDEYQKKSFNSVYEIAKSFVFDINHIDEINTIKDNYKLNNDSDLLVSIIGAFRYGKTTLIKKLFGFSDDYIFPLVDKGRTSLNNCFFRAILVKDNYININNNGEIKKIPVNEYHFINEITLYSFIDFFELTLSANLHNAFELYCNLKKNAAIDIDNIHIKVLEKFIAHDKANLDEIFGDINDEINDSYRFYGKMLNLFSEEYNKIDDDIWDFDENNNLHIPQDYRRFLDKNTDFFEFTIKLLEDKTKKIVNEISSETQKNIVFEKNKIKFLLAIDEIEDIDVYYNNFTSNNSKYRGQLLRLLVSEIYTEIDLDINTLYSQEDTKINKFENLTSIVFTDTMGAGHKSNKNNIANDSSNDIINNLPLLNESDIIILLDDASQSMKDVTLSQLKSIVNFGLKDKLLLTYSWYDHFLKNDMKTDAERVKILCNVLEEKLSENFSINTDLAKKLFSFITANEMERILFLKGLVPYVPSSNKVSGGRRQRKTNSIEETNDENLAKILNTGEDFGEEICFKTLLDKIFSISNKIKELNNSSFSLETNIREADITFNFFEMYKTFYKEYVTLQNREYIIWPPQYKTTEALCNQLMHGNTGFTGVSRSLYPYNDALGILIKHFNYFLDDYFEIIIAEDEDGNKKDLALNEDFILNKIKKSFSDKVGDFFRLLIIVTNTNDWIKFYNDWGPGVQDRRANNIYITLINTLKIHQDNKESNISVSLYNLFQSIVNNIVDQYNDF